MKKSVIVPIFIITLILIFVFLFFFSKNKKKTISSGGQYKTVTQDEAMEIMLKKDKYLIIDVRSKAEYDEGHIPNAISLPVDTIGKEDILFLDNKEQLILVYCRSGNRSRKAAKKLVEKGYTNVIDFGGINTWKGEIVK